jgi:hypothetical protein
MLSITTHRFGALLEEMRLGQRDTDGVETITMPLSLSEGQTLDKLS